MSPKLGMAFVVLIVLTNLFGEIKYTEAAVTCNPLQLSPCASAITSSSKPTSVCCAKIKEQRPCLCQYMKNPNLQKLIKSRGARMVAYACGTPFPKC